MTGAPGAGLAVGLRASLRAEVTGADTAIAAGSGDVPVLATPRLLALAEAAAMAAVAPHLDPAQTCVGTAARLEHRRAVPVGAQLIVEAELTEVDGARLVFLFLARWGGPGEEGGGAARRPRPGPEGGLAAAAGEAGPAPGEGDDGGEGVIGAGTVERVVVDRGRFLAGAATRPGGADDPQPGADRR